MSLEFNQRIDNIEQIAGLTSSENKSHLPFISLKDTLRPIQKKSGVNIFNLLRRNFDIRTATNPETKKRYLPEGIRIHVEDVEDLQGFIQPSDKSVAKNIFLYVDEKYHPKNKDHWDFAIEKADTPYGEFLMVISYPPKNQRVAQEVVLDKDLESERTLSLECLKIEGAYLIQTDDKHPENYSKSRAVDLLKLLKENFGIEYVGLMNSEQTSKERLPDAVLRGKKLLLKDMQFGHDGLALSRDGQENWPIVDMWSCLTWLSLSEVGNQFNPEIAKQAFRRGDFNTVFEQLRRILPAKILETVGSQIGKRVNAAETPADISEVIGKLPDTVRDLPKEWVVPE